MGGLYLILYFSILPKSGISNQETDYEIEYIIEEIPEEDLAANTSEKVKIETHNAFNEDENFIKELENSRSENPKSLDEKLSEIDKAIDESSNKKEGIIPKETATSKTKNTKEKRKSEAVLNSSQNRNTTNSYRLINRKATYFPNPVYVCDAFGKVVLHIEVNASGKVVSAKNNTNSSTTSNVCLIETAIEYAKKARFNTDENMPLQLGSITYIFPGQE